MMISEAQARRNLSNNIRRICQSRGWTMSELSEMVRKDVPQRMIYRLARGETTGSVRTLCALAAALGTTMDYLLEDHGEAPRIDGRWATARRRIRDRRATVRQ